MIGYRRAFDLRSFGNSGCSAEYRVFTLHYGNNDIFFGEFIITDFYARTAGNRSAVADSAHAGILGVGIPARILVNDICFCVEDLIGIRRVAVECIQTTICCQTGDTCFGIIGSDNQRFGSTGNAVEAAVRAVNKADFRNRIDIRREILHGVGQSVLRAVDGRKCLCNNNGRLLLDLFRTVNSRQFDRTRICTQNRIFLVISDDLAVHLPIVEIVVFDFRSRERFCRTDFNRHGERLVYLLFSIQIVDVDGIALFIDLVSRNNDNHGAGLHRLFDAVIGCNNACGIAVFIRNIPIVEGIAHLCRDGCRELDCFIDRVVSGDDNLRIRIAENNLRRGSRCCYICIIRDKLRIVDKYEGVIRARGYDIPGPVHPIQEVLAGIGVGDEHRFTGIVVKNVCPLLCGSALVNLVLRSADLQLKHSSVRSKQRNKVGVTVHRKGIRLHIAQRGFKLCIACAIPSLEGITRFRIGNNGHLVAVVARTAAAEHRNRVV